MSTPSSQQFIYQWLNILMASGNKLIIIQQILAKNIYYLISFDHKPVDNEESYT